MRLEQYTDYRHFLNHHLQSQKRTHHHFSASFWSRKLGIENPASLINVLKGNRHPGKKMIKRLAVYFNMSVQEETNFMALVEFQKNQNNLWPAQDESFLI